MSNVIILNKTFEGAWTEKEGNIAHEIIDFIKTDKGEHYIYNNPFGQCPSDIILKKDDIKNNTKRMVKYILLCSPSKIHYKDNKNNQKEKEFDYCDFYINYCAEIEEILHNKSRNMKNITSIRDDIKKIIRNKEIKYNNKFLYDIYGDNDSTLLVTFKIKRMWQPKNGLINVTTKKYKFQRNKGYIDNNKYPDDYESIIAKIEQNGEINNNIWEEVNLSNIEKKNKKNYSSKSFLDLICKKDSEECYTNILQSILNHKNLLNKFCEKFDKKNTFIKTNMSYENLVKRERDVVGGRIDISADNRNQKIIIENKIYSGLNGVHKEDKISQLSIYYNWGREDVPQNPCCFITCPNFKIKEIEFEINDKDKNMLQYYNIIGYDEISEFIDENLALLKQDYTYKNYTDEFKNIFKNFGYNSKFDFFENMFLDAILNHEETNNEYR